MVVDGWIVVDGYMGGLWIDIWIDEWVVVDK